MNTDEPLNDSQPNQGPQPNQWETQLQSVSLPGRPNRRDDMLYQSGYAAAQAQTAALKRSVVAWRSGCLVAAAAIIVTTMLTLRDVSDTVATPGKINEATENMKAESLKNDTSNERSLTPSQIVSLQGERLSPPAANSLFALSHQFDQAALPKRPELEHDDASLFSNSTIDSGDITWALNESSSQ